MAAPLTLQGVSPRVRKAPADAALAFAAGFTRIQNPFPRHTVAHERWDRDWRRERETKEEARNG